ncbi:hypothetical protein FGO68_gene11310 [Halteria grandinella]|uniref:Uncharacterized protein n=1 Tax=Halteria grandinella TaxID=5974 RepID=A0A8J8NNV8_HALGN|nr:hypothetical protein FGO68_gene11310 [Halteria grandinella]
MEALLMKANLIRTYLMVRGVQHGLRVDNVNSANLKIIHLMERLYSWEMGTYLRGIAFMGKEKDMGWRQSVLITSIKDFGIIMKSMAMDNCKQGAAFLKERQKWARSMDSGYFGLLKTPLSIAGTRMISCMVLVFKDKQTSILNSIVLMESAYTITALKTTRNT